MDAQTIEVTRGHVASVAHDPATRTVSVVFRNSAYRYDYLDVSPEHAEAVVAVARADEGGVGTAVSLYLAKEKYEFAKVDTSSDDE